MRRAVETAVALVTAQLLLLAFAVSEAIAYWKLHNAPPFEPVSQVVGACLIVGGATMWIGLERRQEWVRGIGGTIVALGGFLLLSAQLRTAPAGYVTVLNARAAAGAFVIAMLYALAVLHRRRGVHVPDLPVNLAVLVTAASLFTLSLLTSEIDAYWAARGAGDTWSLAREGLQTIAWASVGGFLIWRGLLSHRGWIRAVGGAVLLIAVLRLLRVQFADASPIYVVALNARVTAAIIVIALLCGLARLYRTRGEEMDADYAPVAVLVLLANVVALALFTSEITAYWHVRDERQFAREMMLSVTWAVYATLLIVAGLRKRYPPIRYFAITVFVITIAKVFAIDLAELDRIYRVLSVIVLGVALLTSSYLYQRLRVTDNTAQKG